MGRDFRSRFRAAVILSETESGCGLGCHAGKRTLRLGTLRRVVLCLQHEHAGIPTAVASRRSGRHGRTSGTCSRLHPRSGAYPMYADRPKHMQPCRWHYRTGPLRAGELLSGIACNTACRPEAISRRPRWEIRKPGIEISVENMRRRNRSVGQIPRSAPRKRSAQCLSNSDFIFSGKIFVAFTCINVKYALHLYRQAG